MIGIIDYGMGNLHSVQNATQKLNHPVLVSNQANDLQLCEKLILPGVGAFGDMMENLRKTHLDEAIVSWVKKDKKPILGICLGMQSFFESSEENGLHSGFGFLKGHVSYMEDQNVRIPHIGWNELEKNQDHPLWKLLSDPVFVYYVHSYYAKDMENQDLIGYSNYGTMKIPSLVIKENVMGCQFHPEKSGEDGLRILKYFLEEF